MVCGAWEARTAVLFITVSASNILKLKENLYPIFFVEPALTCCLHAAGAPSVVFPIIILSKDNEW